MTTSTTAPTDDALITGPEFRRRRIAAGMPFGLTAELLGMSENTLRAIETGGVRMQYEGMWLLALCWLELNAASVLRSYRALRRPIPWK